METYAPLGLNWRSDWHMTPKQRLLAQIRLEAADRPAVMPAIIRWIRGRYHSTSELQQLRTCEEFGFDPLIQYGMYLNVPIANDYLYRPDGWDAYRDLPDVTVDVRTENHSDRTIHIRRFETPAGVLTDRIVWPRGGMGFGDGPNPHREEPLIKDGSDVEALEFLYPDPHPGRIQDLLTFTKEIGERGIVEFYETSNPGAWGLESLGPENMLACATTDQDLLRKILRVSQDQHLRNLKSVLETGHKHFVVSWFQCGLSTGWSPATIQELFLPLIEESVNLVKNYGGYYRFQDDGKMQDIIPRLVDFGVDVIGGLQPLPVGDCDYSAIASKCGGDVCLMGGLDPIYTFERGTPGTVRDETTALLEKAENCRGIIVGTAEAFGPETPEENLRELAKVVHEFRGEKHDS